MVKLHPVLGIGLGFCVLTAGILSGCAGTAYTGFRDKENLGQALFMDTSLSEPAGQACGSCHKANAAFGDPRQDKDTSEGVILGLFGNRQAPTLRYMQFSPPFHYDAGEGDYIGGQFWDGRAVNLADQAHFPLTNPAEMNNPSLDRVVQKVAAGPHAAALRKIYGPDVFSDTTTAMHAITDAIAAFEQTAAFRPFTSKYDYFLKGQAVLSEQEKRGLALYEGKAGCNGCHPNRPGPAGEPPLFTDFTYDNIGLPKNPSNPFYNDPASINPDGPAFIDLGLQKTTGRAEDAGRFKVPTLRNIAISAPYFHNGVIKTLSNAVHFYNERDLGHFPPPEIPATMNLTELGNLGLTDDEVADIVAFLKTLTDGWYH